MLISARLKALLVRPGDRGSLSDGQYQNDVPSHIRRKIRLLQEQEKEMASLEATLAKLEEDHAELKSEMKPSDLQATSKVSELAGEADNEWPKPNITNHSPIQRCPNNVLYLIFSHYVSGLGLGKHQGIMRLLHICQRFQMIVRKSPQLWTRMEVSNPWLLFNFIKRTSNLSYVFSCIHYSASMPLDVFLNFENMTQDRYIQREMVECMLSITDPTDESSIRQRASQLGSWDFNSPTYRRELKKVIQILTGHDGEHASRWSRLILHLPRAGGEARDIWWQLSKSIGGITSLGVKGFPSGWMIIEKSRSKSKGLRSLKSLSFQTGDIFHGTIPISKMFNLSRKSLESLTIDSLYVPEILIGLSPLSMLQTLDLRCIWVKPEFRPFTISLPNLTRLRLSGDYSFLKDIQMKFPALVSLDLELGGWKQGLKLSPRALRLYGKILFPYESSWQAKSAMTKERISRIIQSLDTIQSVNGEQRYRDELVTAISECKSQGKASKVSQLVIESVYDEEIIDV